MGAKGTACVKRGELWIGAGHSAYGGKPRPMLIVQNDQFDEIRSVVLCPVTSQDEEARFLRLVLQPGERTGLERKSWIMVEKLTALPRVKLRKRIGELSNDEMELVSATLSDLLGLAR